MHITIHDIYIKRCLELAKQGFGSVAPNPMVGCVIVNDGKIIAEGYHSKFGAEHAEPNAMKQVSDDILKDSTLYVNLEPCSHFGKTSPCADLIIKKSIKKVVVGNLDPNPLVAGNGIKKLQQAGIEVIYCILDAESKELNKRFFTFHQTKKPYVILKWAQTNNGFISKMPIPKNTEENWITGIESKALVHEWRTQEQAILVGYNTVIADNPKLTARLFSGHNPKRIVIDKNLTLNNKYHVFNNEAPTYIFNSIKTESILNVHYIKIDFTNLVDEILNTLYTLNVNSIIIEGGTKTLNHFINTNAWNEARVFINPTLNFESGVEAPLLNLAKANVQTIGNDKLYTVINNSI